MFTLAIQCKNSAIVFPNDCWQLPLNRDYEMEIASSTRTFKLQSHYSGVRLSFGLHWGDFGSQSILGGAKHIIRNLIQNHLSVAQNPSVRQSSVTAALVFKTRNRPNPSNLGAAGIHHQLQSHYSGVRWDFGLRWGNFGADSLPYNVTGSPLYGL